MAHVLIIEDEVLLAKSLSRALAGHDHHCVTAASAEAGLALLERTPADIVLLDLQLPGMSGLEAIKLIKAIDPSISVLIVTAHATMASAVEAMRSGACDLLRKPLDTEEVLVAISRATEDARLRQTISYYHDIQADRLDEDRLICHSASMKRAKSMLDRLVSMKLASASDYPPILILGETGTGKDLAARIIHFQGPLSQTPFIEVNCSTLPRGLEEAELFGYERGSFTGADRSKRGLFEAASDGTIFLNEVGDLTPEAQVKLLRVLEQKRLRHLGGLHDTPVNVRIIAATNRELEDTASFRSDLYFRLNNATLELPPLRDRKEDIAELAQLFLAKFAVKYGVEKELDSSTLDALLAYRWPGNVRELRQMMERVTFMGPNRIVMPEDLNLPDIKAATLHMNPLELSEFDFPEGGLGLEEVERAMILRALEVCKGNVSQTARLLKIGREALRYRIGKLGLSRSVNFDG